MKDRILRGGNSPPPQALLQPLPGGIAGYQHAVNAAAGWRDQMTVVGRRHFIAVVLARQQASQLTGAIVDGMKHYFDKTSFDDHDYTSHKRVRHVKRTNNALTICRVIS